MHASVLRERAAGRPLLLDLFCGAGGAAYGYKLAGFDVVGVDIEYQPNYAGDVLVHRDAVEYARDRASEFDFVHASPPCQAHSALNSVNRREYADFIPAIRELLQASGVPFVMENVQGSTLRRDLTLCGEMFGLGVIRHRYFEFGNGAFAPQPEHLKHRGRVAGWRHGQWHDGPYFAVYGDGGGKGTLQQWRDAMGMPWCDTRRELAEAIPPAYTKYIGEHIYETLELAA